MADRVYVAQVLSLLSSMTPSALMAMIFIINVGVAYDVTADPRLLAVDVAGSIFNVWRIAAVLVLRGLAS
ncbi:hypothetical protein HNO88_004085 [Novosphingobium chloroacetimidivorans]|uniref:Uncharacterized protein n=1 Tax=Novosphingobium chloroacetimidivorans TaxID=1428314 RepID=A0A7W7KDB8_9SPHN|nr:hypothetical protein [Novosphingobium chloroacetimidivorans]MBB4860740.1 hypothetical protein [Novosphingobium chloroacetimidivorans]